MKKNNNAICGMNIDDSIQTGKRSAYNQIIDQSLSAEKFSQKLLNDWNPLSIRIHRG